MFDIDVNTLNAQPVCSSSQSLSEGRKFITDIKVEDYKNLQDAPIPKRRKTYYNLGPYEFESKDDEVKGDELKPEVAPMTSETSQILPSNLKMRGSLLIFRPIVEAKEI